MNTTMPLWKLALKAAPSSFGLLPASFTPNIAQNAQKNAAEQAEDEQKENSAFYYAAVKTKFCIDSCLGFSEGLATAYFRIMEETNESIFLQGSTLVSNLAKAVFEQDEKLFADTCEKYADEDYFLECVKGAEEQGFAFEGNTLDENSWIGLYKTVLLLTEEFLNTKCDLPIVKVTVSEENSDDLKIIFAPNGTKEEELKDASLLPLEPQPSSSDFMGIGAGFFKFLNENFPSEAGFLEKIFDERICKNLDPLPLPDSIATSIMEVNKLGAYKDNKIYISHRLALDSLRNEASAFMLLLTMLHEYGHFLDDVLHERAGIAGDSEGEEGGGFAARFVEGMLDKNLKFADFLITDRNGEDLRVEVEAKSSEYGEEQRLLDIHFSVMNSIKDTGNLKLLTGETVENVEFWGIDAKGSGHEDLTKEAALEFKYKFGGSDGQDLEEGCAWPDVPYAKNVYETDTDYSHFLKIYTMHDFFRGNYEGDLTYESHFGKNQHWHSMCPKEKGKAMSNEEVKKKIIEQLHEWYNDATCFREENGLFHIGKMLHTVQDSYCFSHCWRHFNFDDAKYNWFIWSFQDYDKQNSSLHGVADSSFVKNAAGEKIQNIGYKKALEASKFILSCYKEEFVWDRPDEGKLYNHLNNSIYIIHPDRKSVNAGESHSWFKKGNPSSASKIENLLYELSQKEAQHESRKS